MRALYSGENVRADFLHNRSEHPRFRTLHPNLRSYLLLKVLKLPQFSHRQTVQRPPQFPAVLSPRTSAITWKEPFDDSLQNLCRLLATSRVLPITSRFRIGILTQTLILGLLACHYTGLQRDYGSLGGHESFILLLVSTCSLLPQVRKGSSPPGRRWSPIPIA